MWRITECDKSSLVYRIIDAYAYKTCQIMPRGHVLIATDRFQEPPEVEIILPTPRPLSSIDRNVAARS